MVTAEPMFHVRKYLKPKVAYLIGTSDLDMNADTVIHVQKASNGQYVTGDDDGGPTPFSSLVAIGKTSNGLWVDIVIRNKEIGVTGHADVTITELGNGAAPEFYDNVIINSGGIVPEFAGQGFDLPANTKIGTIEQAGGADSAFVMAIDLRAIGVHAVAFDEFTGTGDMALATLREECRDCMLIAGRAANEAPLLTKLFWDSDVTTNDPDRDNIGTALEDFLGTNSDLPDSDGDGLPDGWEVFGKNAATPVKLPTWGANPMLRDMFVEVDWICKEPTCIDTPSQNQMQYSHAEFAAANFAQIGIVAHFDIGPLGAMAVPTTTSPTYGDWGGAEPLSSGEVCNLDTMVPSRRDVFRLVKGSAPSGGGNTTRFTHCSYAGVDGGTISHELGHQMGLMHGGGDDINCKPNYASLMSYPEQQTGTGFSLGQHSAISLDSLDVREDLGIGETSFQQYEYLQSGNWSYRLNSSGGVDWNRDGHINTAAEGPVRANLSWAYADCGASGSRGAFVAGRSPSLSWVDAAMSPGLYVPHRYAGTLASSLGKVALLRLNGLEILGCSEVPALAPGDCIAVDGTLVIENSLPQMAGASWGNGAVAMREILPAGAAPYVVIVYVTDGGQLVTQFSNGEANFEEPVLLFEDTVTSSPTIVSEGDGDMRVFAAFLYGADSHVLSWKLDRENREWIGPRVERLDTNGVLSVAREFAVAPGWIRAPAGPVSVLAGLLSAHVPGATTADEYALALYDITTERWALQLNDVWPSGVRPRSLQRMGIAYAPYTNNPALIHEGRFFVALAPPESSETNAAGVARPNGNMMMTMGNVVGVPSGTERRLEFIPPVVAFGAYNWPDLGMMLSFDPEHDTNLLAAFTEATSTLSESQDSGRIMAIYPLADGIRRTQMSDFDDVPVLLSHVCDGIGVGCP